MAKKKEGGCACVAALWGFVLGRYRAVLKCRGGKVIQRNRQTYHWYKNSFVDIREGIILLPKLSNNHMIKIKHFQSKPRSNNSPASIKLQIQAQKQKMS